MLKFRNIFGIFEVPRAFKRLQRTVNTLVDVNTNEDAIIFYN